MSPQSRLSSVRSKEGTIYVTKTQRHFKSLADSSEIEQFCNNKFGFMTSYTETVQADHWTLRVGDCSSPKSKLRIYKGSLEPCTVVVPRVLFLESIS